MSLVFNGVETNKVIWNGAETKGILNGNVLWGIEEPTYEELVNLGSTEYYIQGNSTRNMQVNLYGSNYNTNFNYITFLFDALIWGSTGGQARIIIENIGSTNKSDWWYDNRWGMRDHFSLRTPPQFYNGNGTWHTDDSATSLVNSQSTSLWPENTYKRFKIIGDISQGIAHLYIENTYLGYVTGGNMDFKTWNIIYLHSDQGRSYERAGVKNIKVASFKNLTDAQNWS